MAFLEVKNVALKGISACVPKQTDNIIDIYKWDGAEAFVESTGVKQRRRADVNVITSDLCFHAAETLIEDLKWSKEEVEALIFVTQSPDYILPATSCILQERLGLPNSCFTLDVSLGCSGWVYGLSVLSTLLQSGSIKKGLVLAGDIVAIMSDIDDKSAYPLFGDAGTATALEYDPDASPMKYLFNSDGSKNETIIIRDGGYRNPVSLQSFEKTICSEGIIRDKLHLELDGMNVFSFGITKVPKQIKQLIEHYGIDKDNVDLFTFHQANLMMNEMIRKKLKLPEEKVPYCISEFGNTSSASIPLALVTQERDRLQTEKLQHIACGFGVGLSWGSVWFETDKIIVPKLIEI